MLPEIAAEALHFLSRRDLDKASGVSKWLDAMIAQFCETYPLRPVFRISLCRHAEGSRLKVLIREGADSRTKHSFGGMDEAVRFTVPFLRHSYIEELQVGHYSYRRVSLLPEHWRTLIDAIRSGAVRYLRFIGVDFSALAEDAFLVAVGFPGLQSLVVERCVVPGGFITDALLRSCVAKDLL